MTNREEGMGENDEDVTWSMQEAHVWTVEDSSSENNRPRDPLGYRFINEDRAKHKKKKKEHHGNPQGSAKSEQARVSKVPGYGLGLSRGFSLWRTLKDIRHCITKVSDPMTKAQRRSLRRKLSYYVDDLERIVVGVNPHAPVTTSEDTNSGDEEMREEVNALIEDALDEAALQGKIVQSDYFETRMSYLEQKCATLKKQLEEVSSRTFVQEEAASKAVLEKGNCAMNGPKKLKIAEEEEADGGEEKKHLQKRRDPSSPALHASLCSLQAAVIQQHTGETPTESDGDNVEAECKNRTSPIEEKRTNNGESEHSDPKLLGIANGRSKEDEQKDESERILEEVIRRPGNRPFRVWRAEVPRRGRGRPPGCRTSNTMLKRISLKY